MRLMKPLAGFVLDSGLSVIEMRSIFNDAAVRTAAARQDERGCRTSISGIAASTGLSRAEISKILKSRRNVSASYPDRNQQATNRILSAWHNNPRFTTPHGFPADLKIYGPGVSFETLVREHGRGIPTRALLDELQRVGAVEVRSSQKVRAKVSVAIERGISPRVITAYGDRVTELLSTLLENMRHPGQPRFIANVAGTVASKNELPLFRKELSSRGTAFLESMQETLFQSPANTRSESPAPRSNHVSVTVFYHEIPRKSESKKKSSTARRNFSRSK